MNKPIILLTSLALWTPLSAVQSLESTYRTAGPAVHGAFDDVQPFLQTGSAVFQKGRDEIIFGTVISPDGFILTKASELGDLDGVSVTVDRERYDNPVLVAQDHAWDVALVKIEAEGLIPVDIAGDDIEQGTWVVANGATSRSKRRVQVGIVAANVREVYAKGGTVLGVALKADTEEIVVDEVTEGTGAEAAGLMSGDKIVSFEGEEITDRESLMEKLEKRRVGDEVQIGIERDGKKITLPVELAGRADVFGEEKTRNDAMSGEFSERRTGFPKVMQTDVMGNRRFMGGPVLDLDGRCVGMNIARYSRCETYAIPGRELKELAGQMMESAKTR
ncbi:hypothetical protein HAHE_38830 [Haloferula helveola]|uniref:PDZ domain-containing protein n=1 Tax=Haloferula helveola TaxID=490095 RepID=A0ABN6H8I3_9BACT|nr:hypothetical protein HAHE_38830 [Haloferula helveola]